MIRPGTLPSSLPAAAPAPAAASPPTAQIPPEHSAHEDAAVQQAEAMLADAASRGRWTNQDEAKLREIRGEAPGADWTPVVQKLVVAINSGRLGRFAD